ncbi:MAG: cytochrome c biogenesis protein CcsA [Moraxellaceae bacterium]|nr:cytochrome c biogenesis protein CcsA [Pseudomonadales bacterium]MCB1673578.1 cytochrome c biogenesis protein CcsA [Pseudomonadales bacterium]MCP5174836.1 cytochrome c biogenesis protein CcsA [Moraxellaceae bacterium]MCP5177823.1 cytochrome c biogenesis protein CcsA [Moraxellaceae bacterium]HQV21876.1 cytochrome c biogenesis protein CcsA [Agitococcus sp.]
MIAQFAGAVAIACYLLACVFLYRALATHSKPSKMLILSLGALALPLHGMQILTQVYQYNGINLGFFNVLSLVGWIIACLHIAICSYRPLLVMSLFAYPAAAFGLLASLLFYAPYQVLSHLPQGAESHIILSIFAYSVLFLAALHAILLAIQNKNLKNHRLKTKNPLLNIMPPLQTMEVVLFDFIIFGFILLSLAIISGFITLDDIFAQHVLHKTVLTIFAWFIFGTLLVGHYWQGWRGQRAVKFTLIGFSFLLVGFLGSKFVLEFILHSAYMR